MRWARSRRFALVVGTATLVAGASLPAAPGALAQAACTIEGNDLITVDDDEPTGVRATVDLGPLPDGCGDLTLRVYLHHDTDGDGVPDTAEAGTQVPVADDGRPRSPVSLRCGAAALGFSVYLAPEAELATGSFALDANPYLSDERVLDSYLSPGADCARPVPSSSTSTRLVAAVGPLPPPPASGGGLPFTGTSVAVLTVAALLLLIAGLTLLRAWRLLGIDRL